MNIPITDVSKALAEESRCASDEIVKARHEVIAELARVTAENTRLRAELQTVYEGTKPNGQALKRAAFTAGCVWGFVRRMFRFSWEA